ncbi:hypothetical protein D9757_007107 [Collybiopsis confluens]|uniref:Uncharacterized protein n=1 Tax=Collybiopsis confluens TaxID=2823264 RepID=A0A8H5M4U7_9AGAR|nr:hypothetical protein D9757_007107 [Collybiopsis confluens]
MLRKGDFAPSLKGAGFGYTLLHFWVHIFTMGAILRLDSQLLVNRVVGVNILQLFGLFGSIITILNARFSSPIKRHPTWYNFIGSWVISSISYTLLLFAGQVDLSGSGKSVPFGFSAAATLGLVVQGAKVVDKDFWLDATRINKSNWQWDVLDDAELWTYGIGSSQSLDVLEMEVEDRGRYLIYASIELDQGFNYRKSILL